MSHFATCPRRPLPRKCSRVLVTFLLPASQEMTDDKETPETALWRQTVERLLAGGSTAAEALDGATLILQAYQRQRTGHASPPPEVENAARTSGVRRRVKSGSYKTK